MPRIRCLKPEIFQSPQLMNLAPPARLLFIGCITQADDEGRGIADPRKLRAAIFPGDRYPPSQIAKWLDQLAREGLVRLYAAPAHGKLYCIPTWRRHQKLDRPRPSSYPAPEPSPSARRGLDESSTIDRRAFDEASSTARRGSNRIEPKQTGSNPARARGLRGARAAQDGTPATAAADIAEFIRRMPGMSDSDAARHLRVDEATVKSAREATT